MPRPTRKAATQKNNTQKKDDYHNRFDQPCCRLLQEVKDEIISKPTDELSLASAIRYYLQTEVTPPDVPSNHQTKKKKKKKKKKTVSEEEKEKDTEENGVDQTTESRSDWIQTPLKEDVPPSSERSSRRRRLLYSFLAKSNQNVTQRPPSASLRSFVEYLTEKRIRCQIQSSTLQQAVNDINCESCRNSVQEYLNKNSMLILNFGGIDEDRDEAHFDYVAMEEGLGQEKERWYFQRDSSAPSQSRGSKEVEEGAWELHYSAASSSDGENPEQLSNPWKWERFHFFLENGILLPALSIDDILGFDGVDKIMPKEVVKDIVDRVYRLCERREDTFCEWATLLDDTINTFQEQVSMHGVGGNIEMSSFAVMKSTDETCQQILRNLFATMWEVTQHVLSVNGSSQRYAMGDSELSAEATDEEKTRWTILRAQRQADQAGNAVFATLFELWHAYSETMEHISLESAKYEKKVEEQANAQGSIPAMYCSAEVRELYRLLVQAKFRATYRLIDRFQTLLDTKVNLLEPLLGKDTAWNVSWFRYLIAQTTYRDSLGDYHGNKRRKKNGGTLSFDEMLQTVVLTVAKWVMESVHQGTVQKVLLEHEQKRKYLFGMVEKLFETGERHLVRDTSEGSHVPDSKNSSSLVLNELGGLRDDLSNADYATDISSVDRSDAILKMAALRLKTWKRCVALMPNWVQCSLSLNLVEKSTETYDYGWLVLASTAELPFTLKKELYLQQTGRFGGPCLGGTGGFRAECTLLGLIYRWMSERFKEWQAVVAEQDLLLAMSEEKSQAPPNLVLGKKNKKKRTPTKKLGTDLQEPLDKNSGDAVVVENSTSSTAADTSSVRLDNAGHSAALEQPELVAPDNLLNDQNSEMTSGIADQELTRATPEETLQALPSGGLGKKNKKKKSASKKAALDAAANIYAVEVDHAGHSSVLNQPEPFNAIEKNEHHVETADVAAEPESIRATSDGKSQAPTNAASGKKSKTKKTASKKAATSLQESNRKNSDDAIATENGTSPNDAPVLYQSEVLHQKADPADQEEPEDGAMFTLDSDVVDFTPNHKNEVSSMGVLDGDKFVPAEEFLVTRFTTVMRFPMNITFITS